jgi:hypothetical protein
MHIAILGGPGVLLIAAQAGLVSYVGNYCNESVGHYGYRSSDPDLFLPSVPLPITLTPDVESIQGFASSAIPGIVVGSDTMLFQKGS